ncbi:MAG: hypothetical protein ACD_21C00072G0019 [uncultured bacterium]|nr:MAG: hypothetical protein ACD_21C00072G0019 [uncultured bacterium]
MSLINKMLNELEKNRKKDDPVRKEILSSIYLTTQKHKNAFAKKALGWGLILAVIIGVFFYYRLEIINNKTLIKFINLPKVIFAAAKKPPAAKTSTTAAAPTTATATATPPPPPEIKKPVVPTEPAIKLKDITLHTTTDKTIIDFVLSAPPLYYIEHSSDQQQLFITLSNTGLLGNLPVALENSFIIALNTKQSGTSITCTLTLLPGTKIDELQLITAPQSILHLVLSNPQLTSSKMLKVPIPVSLEQEEEQRYQNVLDLLAQNNIKEAITQLHLFIGDFTNNLPAREMLAGLLIKEGVWHKADDVLMVGLNKYPKHTPFIKLKARILVEQGKIDTAINLLQRSSASFAEDSEYFALLAVLYQQQGQFMKAAELYNQLTKTQPQKAAWWVGLGLALESAGKKNAAKEAYSRAYNSLETSPDLIAFLADKIKK